MLKPKELGQVLLAAGQGWLKHGDARLAAALSFYTAVSLAPLLTMILFVAGQVWGSEAASGFLVNEIETMTDRQAAVFIQSVVARADRPEVGSVAGLVSFLILAWGSTRLFFELQASLNVIWELKSASKLRRQLSHFAKRTRYQLYPSAGRDFFHWAGVSSASFSSGSARVSTDRISSR